MDNPTLILQSVDRHLDHAVSLVIYGRAALCLGFETAPPETAKTMDVDAIISARQSEELAADPQFWDAMETANAELAERGLYMTHLFNEREIFLRHDWQRHVVPVSRPVLQRVKLFRPATVDFVLSKMMRGNDPQDMTDAKFLIEHDRITKAQLEQAFTQMNPVELVELRDSFQRARPIVLDFACD